MATRKRKTAAAILKAIEHEPRRLEPGATFSYTDGEGTTHSIRANDEGVVTPRDAFAVAALEAHGAPVARAVVNAVRAEAAEVTAATQPEPSAAAADTEG